MAIEETYFMRGTYEQDGREHAQVGILKIDSDSTITGWVMDPDSPYLRENVEGSSKLEDGRLTISLIKKHGNSEVEYVLTKTDMHKGSFPGRYKGSWIKLEAGKYLGRDTARMALDNMV